MKYLVAPIYYVKKILSSKLTTPIGMVLANQDFKSYYVGLMELEDLEDLGVPRIQAAEVVSEGLRLHEHLDKLIKDETGWSAQLVENSLSGTFTGLVQVGNFQSMTEECPESMSAKELLEIFTKVINDRSP